MSSGTPTIQYVTHIESYVSSSTSPAQQAASIDAIALLLKNDLLSLEALVREMEMYLTTTDSSIRSRGILLLGELLMRLVSKPLGDTAISSLIEFFTERLADWKALHGALVGCLALLRRKKDTGMINKSQAKAVAESYLKNLQVQSLGLQDRKLCLQILECLLDRYRDALFSLGDDLVYGICEAIDGEKDPQCLMLLFHIVELLAQLFPEPSGPLANYAGDLFDFLGCYFPIHFTHPKSDDVDVKKGELSRALMLAFASTPLFEPTAIPLLLEKLSSSLPSAKVESFKYLSYCTLKYGGDRMEKYTGSLWSALKDAIFTNPQSTLSVDSDPVDGLGFHESEIMTQALELLQVLVRQHNASFLSLILGDGDISTFLNSFSQLDDFNNLSTQYKQRLHAVGRLLSVCIKSSASSCNKVFESFFPRLVDALRLSVENSHETIHSALDANFNFGALYLCVEFLAACRQLVVSSHKVTSASDLSRDSWCQILRSFCTSLCNVFFCLIRTSSSESTWNAYVYAAVKGLEILATFPGSFISVSKLMYENILLTLTSIIESDFNKKFLWKAALKALVEINLFVNKYHEDEKAASFNTIVRRKIVSLISSDDLNMPQSLKLEAIFDIGVTGKSFMLSAVSELEKTISASLSEIFVCGDRRLAELTAGLLECYSNKVLPWFHCNGGVDEVSLNLAINIFSKMEKSTSLSLGAKGKELLDATMAAMKQSVAGCSVESQEKVLQKAFDVMATSSFFVSKDLILGTDLFNKKTQLGQTFEGLSCRDEWITSLFTSVVIALRPQTRIPNIRLLLQLLATTLLEGHIPSAQALGSLVNKLPLNISEDCSLEKVIDTLFKNVMWCNISIGKEGNDGGAVDMSNLKLSSLNIHAVVGLAWIGKGLLMRGHEKLKDVTMTFLNCLVSNGDYGNLLPFNDQMKDRAEQKVLCLRKSAADAFHILMNDSDACLNRNYHASIRPLYKQRFFNIMMPMFLSALVKCDSSTTRCFLYQAFVHLVSETPLAAVVGDAKKVVPVLMDCFLILSKDVSHKEIIYSALIVLSGILTDKNGQEAIVENAPTVIGRLIELTSYPYMMVIRETAIQCLGAMSELPHARIYPMRTQVLQAITKALDDPKRVVRLEAVKCRLAWASMASRSIHF
ncbi:MMS19 nucleotide excision repair protein homolog isoform X2 [Lycium ferocissimum]|uniref:MMS19 nucleotide excision repair protein homolog isoform X2 n=1 Tax=Lycium ferocissimum TaxID=112874 RepID=UPI0028155D59|nr:MMS19 nucleotide excision repair protein homolog isoform X2 [Lycium ferocissimum]